MTNARTLEIVAIAGLLCLAGCGIDTADQAGDVATAGTDATAGSTTEPAVDDTMPPDDTSLDGANELPDVALDEPDAGATAELTSPAMGGVRFAAAEQHSASSGNDFVSVRLDEPGDDMKPEANVALITQSVTQSPIMTIDDYLSAVSTDPSAMVEPTGDALDLLGYRLTGYEISNDATTEDPMLFSANRVGAEVTSVAAPFPYSRVYLAETPVGVLQAAIEGLDAEHADQATGAFSLLVDSIEFTGAGLDAPLPPGEVIESSTPTPPPDPAPPIEDGPAALESAFEPVDAATYQLLNTGSQTTIVVPEGWFVQPNFPGIVVFTAPDSQGPGDRDLVITRNVSEFVPTGAGPHAVGPVQTIEDVDAFIQAVPSGVTVSDVSDVDFGALDGVQFDLTTDSASDCSDDDPCELSLLTTFGFAVTLRANHDHRIWWIDMTDGPLVMVATALEDEEFIDRAEQLALSLDVS